MSLSNEDLLDVYKETFNARGKWKSVLLELGLKFESIKSIDIRCRGNPDECYLEGLSLWLRTGERRWCNLVEALSSHIVGHRETANEIERKHLQTQVAIQPSPGTYRQAITGELIIFTNEQLGSGAFGTVFKGTYRETRCAIKVLHKMAVHMQTNLPVGRAAESAIETFDRECEFLKSFQHPHIVQHLSTEKHPTAGYTILVIELMDCNLRAYFSSLGEESLSSQCQISLSRDVASGLAYIHSKSIIHRDLCGDNVLLKLFRPIPVAKISDFGMSRLLDLSQASSTLTAIGHRMGYLPPEAPRLEEEQYDYSLDVFSLGVVMVQIVHKLKTVKTPKDRKEFVVQIPNSHVLKDPIHKCLQEDMRMRPTASQVYDELRLWDAELAHTTGAVISQQDHPEDRPPAEKVPGTRPLMTLLEACKTGNLEVVQELLESGADPNQANEVRVMCAYAKATVNTQDKNGFTALHIASLNGYYEVVANLLRVNANVNIKNTSTALHFASYKGHTEVVRALLAAKTTVNPQDKWGQTPLLGASWNDHLPCVELLLEAGANVNVPNEDNSTALHFASEKGHTEVVRALLAAKATVNPQDKWGQTPLWNASLNGHLSCVEPLLEAGADVDMQQENGATALHIASVNGHYEVVANLLRLNTDVHIKDNGTVRLLLEAGANVNVLNEDNVTPLMTAANKGHVSIVQFLLSKGAQPHLKAINGETAYDLAHQNGHTQVCELLSGVL